MKFTCTCCGEEQETWPAIAYNNPIFYHFLSDEDKSTKATLTSDTCIVNASDAVYYFIRTVLVQKVNNACQNLEYGVWVSLSQENFEDYTQNSEKADHQEVYFGWLNTYILGYEYEELIEIKTRVVTQGKGLRPIIEIPKDENKPSKLVKDYFEGISEKEALKRIETMLKK